MIGKSVRLMWTVQNLAFLRLVSHCAPFPAAPARPAAARGRYPWAVRLHLGGMGAGEYKASASRELALRIPKTQKRPPSLSKIPQKTKRRFSIL